MVPGRHPHLSLSLECLLHKHALLGYPCISDTGVQPHFTGVLGSEPFFEDLYLSH